MLLRIGIIIAVVVILGFAVKMYGDSRFREGKATNVIEQHVKSEKKKNETRKNQRQIRKLDDDALVARYCEWVLYPYDKCLREYRIAD